MKHGSLVALIQLKTKQIIDPSFPITREGRLDLGSTEHILILELASTLVISRQTFCGILLFFYYIYIIYLNIILNI